MVLEKDVLVYFYLHDYGANDSIVLTVYSFIDSFGRIYIIEHLLLFTCTVIIVQY